VNSESGERIAKGTARTGTDGGLRQLLRSYLPLGDWVSVETGATAGGVPDSNYCFSPGREGWVENKKALGWQVAIRPSQIGWIMRRTRRGGRASVLIRKEDTLYWVKGSDLEEWSRLGHLNSKGEAVMCPLKNWDKCWVSEGGPARWDWAHLQELLTR